MDLSCSSHAFTGFAGIFVRGSLTRDADLGGALDRFVSQAHYGQLDTKSAYLSLYLLRGRRALPSARMLPTDWHLIPRCRKPRASFRPCSLPSSCAGQTLPERARNELGEWLLVNMRG
jgi:hypothetical protein